MIPKILIFGCWFFSNRPYNATKYIGADLIGLVKTNTKGLG